MVEAKVNTGEIKNILKDALDEVHQAISSIIPAMREASTADVLKSIKDPTCLFATQRVGASRKTVGGHYLRRGDPKREEHNQGGTRSRQPDK